MRLHAAPSIEEQPFVVMCGWQVFETEKGQHHLVGVTYPEECYRTTSPLITYLPGEHIAQTSSGRLYLIYGEPEPGEEADGAWQRWCEFYQVSYSVNVSDQYTGITPEELEDGKG